MAEPTRLDRLRDEAVRIAEAIGAEPSAPWEIDEHFRRIDDAAVALGDLAGWDEELLRTAAGPENVTPRGLCIVAAIQASQRGPTPFRPRIVAP